MNKGGGKAAVRNFGTAYLNGGTYTRSNSTYYIIKNVGHMTIGENAQSTVKVVSEDERSSLIANGYYGENDKNAHAGITVAPENACTMIINGGTFTGGMVTVKNDDEGVLTIYDGTFTNSYYEKGYSGSVITAAGNLVTINGGTFTQEESAAHGLRIAASGNVTTTVVVAGGTFTEGTDVYLMNGGVDDRGKPIPTGTLDVTIEDGVFNGTLNTENFNGKVLETDAIKITGGTFNADLALGSTMKVAISGGDYKSIPNADYLDESVKMYQYTQSAGEKSDYFVIVGAEEAQPANTEEAGYIRVDNVGYANTLAEAFEMAAENKKSKIYLCADITESVTYTGGYMTIYLDGHTWEADGDQPALTNQNSASILYIRSSKGVDGGAIVRTTAGPVIVNEATLTLGSSSSSGKYTVKNESAGGYALIENSGRLTVTSGTFESAGTLFVNNGEKISVNGGTFDREVDAEFIANGYTCVDNGDGTYGIMKVVAQIVRGEETLDYTDWATAVNALQNGDTLVMLASVEGGLTIKEGLTVSLELRSGNLNGGIDNNGNLTIYGEGTVIGTITNGANAVLAIAGGNYQSDLQADGQEITITGGTFKGGLTTSAGTGSTYIHHIAPYVDNENGYYLIDHTQAYSNKYTVGQGEAVALIEDGEFSMYAGSIAVAQGYLKMGAGTDVKVTLCANVESFTFNKNSQSLANNVTFDLNGKSIAGDITVNNGLAVTIIGNGTVEGTVKATEGTLSIQGGTFNADVSAYLPTGYEQLATGEVVASESVVAQIVRDGETLRFASLQDAIDEADAGDTVVLLADMITTGSVVINKSITFDLGGNKLSGSGMKNLIDVITDGAAVMIKNGSIEYQHGGTKGNALHSTHTDLTLDGVNITSDYYGVVFIGNMMIDDAETANKSEFDKLVITGGSTISAFAFAVSGNGSSTSAWSGTDITVENATLEGQAGAAVYHPQYGVITLNEGAVLTGNSGIEIRAGELHINGATITADGKFLADENGNGNTTDGAAIIVVQHTTEKKIVVDVKDGTFSATGEGGKAFYQGNPQKNDQDAIDKIEVNVQGGTFNGDIYSENIKDFISGGTFDTAFSEDYLGSSRYLYTSGNGYGVGTQNDANGAGVYFFVGQRGYNTLQAAIDSIDPVAEDELNDEYETDIDFRVSGSEPVKLNEGQTVTIGKGKNIRFYSRSKNVRLLGSIVVEKGGRLSVYNSSGQVGDEDNLVTITNSGTVYFNAGTRYVNVENSGVLTIASGTYQGGKIENDGTMVAAGVADPVFNGTQFIANGGSTARFERGKFDESVTFTENGGEISLQGGSYAKALTNADGQNIAQYVPETHEFTLSATENMVSIIKTAAATVQVEMSDGTIYRFTVFSTAVAMADDGATITLLDDIDSVNKTIEIVNKSLTFDLGGHTISTTGTSYPNYLFDISIGNATIIFRNGTIDVHKTAIKLHSGTADVGADGELILESTLTIESGDYVRHNAVFVFAEVGNTVSLTSYATLSSERSAAIMGNGAELGTLNIDILGGSVTSGNAVAMYLPQATCTTTIANADITGTTGIEIRNGTLVISGDTTITATGDFSTDATPSVGGNTVLGGAAIAVSKYDNEKTSLSVTIDGGTFTATGANGKAFYEGYPDNTTDGTHEFANGAPVVSITGGTFNGEVEAKNITKFISGGSYTKSFNNDYLAAGYALEGSEGNYTVEVNAAAVCNDTAYETLQAAIDAAGENAATITLLQNVTEDVRIDGGQNVTLDLNGCTITNNGSYAINNAGTLVIVDNAGDGSSANMIASNFDTIYNTGTLTVGKNVYVDALSHGEAAVYNEVGGTFTLDGGRLARSDENGISSSNNGGNSFYVLLNHGTATLNGIIQQRGGYSSLIENGWQNGNDNTQRKPSVMTITGGEYSGGLNTVKNDDYGQLTITGGTFSNISQAAVMNWNVAEINGGTFEINEGAFAVVVNGYLNDTMDQGKLTITGGTFTGGTIIMQNSNAADIGEVAVSGGTFGEPVPEDYLDRDGTDNPLYALQYDSETDAYTLVENSEPQAMIIDASGVSYRYATLVNALEAAQNGDEIVLLADIGNAEEYASVFLTLDRDIQLTFGLGGHTIYADATDSSTGAFFTITQGSLTVDNGQIYVIGSDTYNAETGDGFRVTPEGEGAVARLTLGSGLSVTSQYANAVYIGKAGSAYAGDVFNAYLTTEANLTANGRYAAIQGNGTKHGTSIVINGGTITSKDAAIYHPQYGQLTINGGTITGTTGIELRAGTLTIKGGEIIATGDFAEQVNGNGGTLNGVAIGISQHTTELPISVNITAGTFKATGTNGKAFYETDTVTTHNGVPVETLSEGVTASLAGGVFDGTVAADNITGFISGGQYAELPAEGLFAEGYEGAFYGATGYYEVIESVSDDLAALLTAQANAQADVRGALAAYGWTMAYVEQLAAQEGEALLKANAAALVAAYADITEATSEYSVAQARLAAINALDGLLAEFDGMKAAAAGEIAAAAEAKEEADGQPAQEAVVVPTATYNAIYAARNKAELESLLENALAEIADIRSYRAQIAAQSTQLDEIEKAVGELNSGLFTDNTGAIDSILNTIEAAREQITGVAADADAASLAELNEYLTETIQGSLDTINTLLNAFAEELLGAYNKADGTFAGNGTLDTLLGYFEGDSDIFDAITQAKNEIMGAANGEGGMSISDLSDSLANVIAAFEENGTIAGLQNDLTAVKEALLGTSGIDDRIDSILEKIDSVIGTNGTTLDSILSAVGNANTAIGDVKTLLDGWSSSIGLLGSMNTTLTNAAADIGDLTGALLDASGELSSSITEAIADIESIRQSIASLADGDDVTAITGDLTDILADIAALQTTVDSIANSVSASTAVEEAKDNAMTDLRDWLNDYLDSLLGADSAQAGILVARAAYTPETTDGDIYARLTQAFSEDNANLVLRYYNEALAAIDAATTISDVTTAVSTFRAQVASVEASAQNTPSLTGVYVLLAVVLVLIVVACIVMLLKGRREVAAQTQAQPETQPEESAPAAAAQPEEVAEEPAAPAEEPAAPAAAPVEELAAEEDGDKEHIVIAANVRSFSEAYMDLTDEQRDLFNKVREYALAKEGAVEVKQSGGVVIKREGKQVVKLTVRRDMPVALFLLENEMLKTFRRNAKSEAKLKVRATELVIRDEDDLETAYTMVDLSVDQIEKDIEAAKERRKELRRQRRLERQAQQAAAQAESAAAEAPADGTAAETPAPDAGEGGEE